MLTGYFWPLWGKDCGEGGDHGGGDCAGPGGDAGTWARVEAGGRSDAEQILEAELTELTEGVSVAAEGRGVEGDSQVGV